MAVSFKAKLSLLTPGMTGGVIFKLLVCQAMRDSFFIRPSSRGVQAESAQQLMTTSIPSGHSLSQLSSRLPLYRVATGAALAATAGSASGAVIFNTGNSFTVSTSQTSVSWDVDGGGTSDFNFTFVQNYPDILANRQNLNNAWVKPSTGGSSGVAPLAEGFTVGPALAANQFQTGQQAFFIFSGTVQGDLNAGDQYVGFRFDVSGQIHYGWARITLTEGNSSTANLTMHEWAYEGTPGTAIQVGAVPEPASTTTALSLLSLGAAGVAAYRRHRAASAESRRPLQ